MAGDPVRIRIGVHLGDVVRTGSEILGDSVNVAARIQAIAPPGGITVSEDVYRAVRNRVNVPFRDLGPKSLKNIREKIRIYELDRIEGADGVAATPSPRSQRRAALAALGIALVAGMAVLGHHFAQQRGMVGTAPATRDSRARVAAGRAPSGSARSR